MVDIFLTGGSGFLGQEFCRLAPPNIRVHACFFQAKKEELHQAEHISYQKLNVMVGDDLQAALEAQQPKCIIHAAAISSLACCEEFPAMSHHVNVYATIQLAEWAERQGIPFLFCSTDMVFNGQAGPYEEDDFCFPINIYGRQKREAEEHLLEHCKRAHILRLPLLYGLAPQNFLGKAIASWQAGQPVSAFCDEYRSPLSVQQAAKALLRLALLGLAVGSIGQSDFCSVRHLPGTEGLSRHAFLQLALEQLNWDAGLLEEAWLIDYTGPRRPADLRLMSSLRADNKEFMKPLTEELNSLLAPLRNGASD